MKKLLPLLLVAVLLFGCGKNDLAEPTISTTSPTESTVESLPDTPAVVLYSVGVCLPEQSEQWQARADEMKKQLAALN